MHKLTGKQCRTARSLLKWNVYDLATHVNSIPPRRIESFEKGVVHIVEWENDEMVQAFRNEGIVFNSDLDVTLIATKKNDHAVNMGVTGEGARIVLDADQTVISDSTTKIAPRIGVDASADGADLERDG
jgi:hypothetical protein